VHLDLVKSELSDFVLRGNFVENWENIWAPQLTPLLDGDELDLSLLSKSIREIFLSAHSGKSRSPANAGNQWRRFLWCILSILSSNGDELVIYGHPMSGKVLPQWMRERLSIIIGEGGRGLTHEPDLVLIKLDFSQINQEFETFSDSESLRKYLDINRDAVLDMTILWAKTNFNDMMQQHMLWANIGMLHGYALTPPVRHAWVTLPSQKPEKFRPNTVPFIRASTFDAGSYWGLGNMDIFGMQGVFDIIPDWKERIIRLRHNNDLTLLRKLGLT
jgi:hypothetical protein